MEYQEINFYLLIVFAGLLAYMTIHLIVRALNSKELRKNYYLSIAVFSGSYFICRVMLTINFLLGYDPHSVIYQWATFFVLVGFAGLMYSVEKFIYQKLKFIPTSFILLFAALVLIYPRTLDGTNLITYYSIIGGAFGILIPLLYLYVGSQAAGDVRKNAYYIAIGAIIFIVGKTMNTVMLQEAVPILWIMAPVLMMIGLIIFQYQILRKII